MQHAQDGIHDGITGNGDLSKLAVGAGPGIVYDERRNERNRGQAFILFIFK